MALLLFVGSSAALVVSTRSPARQVVVLSVYGLLLALLYLVVQAPDLSLSELVVGAIVLPMPLLTAIAETKRDAKGPLKNNYLTSRVDARHTASPHSEHESR